MNALSLSIAGALLCALGLYGALAGKEHGRRVGIALCLEGTAALLAAGALRTFATAGQVGALFALMLIPLVYAVSSDRRGSAAAPPGDDTPSCDVPGCDDAEGDPP